MIPKSVKIHCVGARDHLTSEAQDGESRGFILRKEDSYWRILFV